MNSNEFSKVTDILSKLADVLASGLSPEQREFSLRGTPIKVNFSSGFDQIVVYQALLNAYKDCGNIDFAQFIFNRIQGYRSFYRPVGPEIDELRFLINSYVYSKKQLDQPSVFVLMPFKEQYFVTYEKCIKPTLENLGCVVEHADEVKTPDSIIDIVLAKIKKAHFLVADTTEKNPNVFYEIGYAHALDKKVILIVQDTKDLPFDVAILKHIRYSPNALHALGKDLADMTVELLKTSES